MLRDAQRCWDVGIYLGKYSLIRVSHSISFTRNLVVESSILFILILPTTQGNLSKTPAFNSHGPITPQTHVVISALYNLGAPCYVTQGLSFRYNALAPVYRGLNMLEVRFVGYHIYPLLFEEIEKWFCTPSPTLCTGKHPPCAGGFPLYSLEVNHDPKTYTLFTPEWTLCRQGSVFCSSS